MATVESTSAKALSAEEMFDSIGPAYEEAFAGLEPQLKSLQWILAQIEDRRPAKVLDLGCGTGRPVCTTLADAGHDVLGVDVSGVMLSDARTKVPNAKFMKADAYQMDVLPGTYDAITVYFSLAPGSTRDQIKSQIQRIYNWLKADGVFVLAEVPNPNEKVLANFVGRPFIASGLLVDEYIACLEDVGFEIVYHNVTSFRPKAVEAGICGEEEVNEEDHVFVYATKKRPTA